MAGAGLGDLFEGFKGGRELAMKEKRNSQLDKIYDYAIEEGQYNSEARRKGRKANAEAMGTEYEPDFEGWSETPWTVKLRERIDSGMKSLFGKKARDAGVADPDTAREKAMGYTTPELGEVDYSLQPGTLREPNYAIAQTPAEMKLADGGRPNERLTEEQKRQMNEDLSWGNPITAARSALADSAEEGAIRARYEAQRMDDKARDLSSKRGVGRAAGATVLGAGARVANSLANLREGAADFIRPTDPRAREAVPTEPVAQPPRGPQNARGRVGRSQPELAGVSVTASRAAEPGAKPAAGAIPEAPQAAGSIDPSLVDIPLDALPSVTVKDWEQYRAKMMQAAGATGDPAKVKAAMDQVTAMQHSEFMRYGMMALQSLQAGDEDGAAKALHAAYQHFPNGSSVKFGTYGDKLVAIGIDEATGQPKGAQPIDAQMLAKQLSNFQNPDNFRVWTKDWHSMGIQDKAAGMADRQQKLAEDRYRNVEVPNAESERAFRASAAASGEANAAANLLKAGDGSGTSMRPITEADGSRMIYGLIDEAMPDDAAMSATLKSLAVMLWQSRPELRGNPALAAKAVLIASSQPGGLEKLMAELGQ